MKGVGLQDASENPRPATAKIGVFSLSEQDDALTAECYVYLIRCQNPIL